MLDVPFSYCLLYAFVNLILKDFFFISLLFRHYRDIIIKQRAIDCGILNLKSREILSKVFRRDDTAYCMESFRYLTPFRRKHVEWEADYWLSS